MVPQADHRDAGVLSFTAHSVVFTDEDPGWVHETLRGLDCDPLAATMNPRFLGALMERTGRRHDTTDLLTVAPALPGGPPVALKEIADPEHPRVARARLRRDDVRMWAADGGVLVLGRGVAGRWETAIEVDEEARHRGLGRLLAVSARHLVPDGGPVWSQQSPGTPAVCGRSRRPDTVPSARRRCSPRPGSGGFQGLSLRSGRTPRAQLDPNGTP